MKKTVILVLGAILVGVTAVLSVTHWKYSKESKEQITYPEYAGQSQYCPEVFYSDGYHFLINSEITWWCQANSQDELDEIAKEFKINFQNISFDFSEESCLVTFGRRLIEIRYQRDPVYYGYTAKITLDDSYDGYISYIYKGPSIDFVPFNDGIKIYKQVNGERIFWGWLSEINETVPSEHKAI